MYHVELEPYEDVQRATSSPFTAITFFQFDGDPPNDYLERAQAFRQAGLKESGPKPLCGAYGITHEEAETEDTSGKAVVFIAGWESVEAHEAFKASKTFKEFMPRLVDGVQKVGVYHVPFRKVEAP